MKEIRKNNPQDGGEGGNDSRAALLLQERKKIINNLFLMLAASFAVLVGALTMAWFANNTSVSGTNMSVTVKGPNYVITATSGGNNGQYYTKYHSLVQDENALVWQMTAENNMDNYNQPGSNDGIHPGSYGVMSFNVTPRIDTVYLDFEFEIYGYVASENETTHVVTMTLLDQEDVPAKFLNGHILLFGGRSGTSDNYVYSDPILSNEDMKRFLSRKRFNGSGTVTPVNIYWVWPKTLSKLVDATDCVKINVTETPFMNTTGDDYTSMVQNILMYPDYYLRGIETDGDDDDNQSGNAISETDLSTDYDIYGDYYDQADNDIGMGVNYVLLKMSVSESTH